MTEATGRELTVAEALSRVLATRLAHFTPARNLPRILGDRQIRSSSDLAQHSPEYFSPTDRERFDQQPDKVCCSLEYPNVYYLAQARGKSEYRNYPDWACLILDVGLVTRPGTLFSPCNAAKGWGAHLRAGGAGLLACYQPQVGQWRRGPQHATGVPTDLQAEVLIPGPISLSHVRGIVVPSFDAAHNEHGRLDLLGVRADHVDWLVAPTFFDKQLSVRLRYGQDVSEIVWLPPQREGERHEHAGRHARG